MPAFLKQVMTALVCLIMLVTGFYAKAGPQPKDEITGRITHQDGKPAKAASVKNLRTGKTSFSNNDGSFTIEAVKGDEISIMAEGYRAFTATVSDTTSINVVLEPLNAGDPLLIKQETVALIYTRTPAHLTATSTEALYSKDILKSPVTSVRNTLTGRMAGLYSSQGSGQPGADGVSLLLRGQDLLVIIDGVVAGLSVFNLEDVESVTLQKDALSTAMLGVRGSSGALLITTRKGKADKQQISFTAQTSSQKPVSAPKTLGAYEYTQLYNEALVNDGLPVLYTTTDLDAYKNGTDPFGHPNVDWRSQVLKQSSRFDRYSLHATGGNNFARYYVSLEHVNQTGFFKTSDSNRYNTNNDFKTYVIRSNIDVSINKQLTGGIYLLGRILNGTEPGVSTSFILANLSNTPANAYPARNPNGSFGGSQQFQNNILAQTIASGYRTNYKRDMLANFYLKHLLGDITPGLWAQVKVAYNATLSENITRSKTFAVYQMITSPTGTSYNQYGTNGVQGNGNGIEYQGRSDYEELSVGYDRTFMNKHGVNAIVLTNRDNIVAGSDLPYTITGVSGRFAYNYEGKYIAEAAFGYNGSNRYADNGATKRGFLPAIGVGWNMEKETFLEKYNWLTRLKLFASYGKTGWDDPGYFSYIQRFFDANSVFFGTGASGNTAITEQPLANTNMSWEKANKFNIGIEGSVLNNKLGFSVEYYNNKYYDLLMQRGRSITIIGNDYPRENIGQNRYKGVETKLNWQQTIHAFQYFITANLSIQKSEVLFIDEVFRQYEWMKRTGQRIGQPFGYISEGLFQTPAEVSGSATTVGYSPQPGDIKYKDLNADGIINQFDIAPIGRKKPLSFFGLSIGAEYKGFDFSALLQGVYNRDIYLGGPNIWAFQNGGFGQAYEHNLQRWTTATASTASFPRLSIGDNSNNQATSSYWLRNGDYARLKNIEIGYSLPESVLKHVRLETIRVFVRGYNLVTFSSPELFDRDPEVSGGFFYPLQKLYNFGITIKL